MKYLLNSSWITGQFTAYLDRLTQGDVGGFASTVMGSITGYAIAVAGIGFMISWAIGSVKTMYGGNMAWGFIIKLVTMALILVSYGPVARMVFSALQAPSRQVMIAYKGDTKNMGTSTGREMDKAQKKVEDQHDERARKSGQGADKSQSSQNGGLANATHEITVADVFLNTGGTFYKMLNNLIFKFVCFIVDLLSLVVDIIYIVISKYLLEILYALGPIAIAFSFFKPLEGSVAGWFKYVVVISLWTFILSLIDLMNMRLGATEMLANMNIEIERMGDGLQKDMMVEQMANMVIAFKIGLIIIKLFVPKIADVIISGSQGGNFFTAASGAFTGLGAKVMGGVIKAA